MRNKVFVFRSTKHPAEIKVGWIDNKEKHLVTYYATRREKTHLLDSEDKVNDRGQELYVILRDPGKIERLLYNPQVENQHEVIDIIRATPSGNDLFDLPKKIDSSMYQHAKEFAHDVAVAFKYELEDRIRPELSQKQAA